MASHAPAEEMGDISDDDDSMDDEEEDAENLAQIKVLDQKIESSPYEYQAHVERISLLQKCGEFEKLGAARKCMAKIFPLTQDLWMSWLQDEQKYAESEEEHANLEALFEDAVKDYMCPEIWLEYAQYSIRYIGNEGGIDKMRNILERALSAVGLHVCNGAALWEAYREIENAILMTMQPKPGSVSTPEENDVVEQQSARIGLLFSRQLAIPLLDMETTMSEYIEWRKTAQDGEVPAPIQQSYERALKTLGELKIFETALENKDAQSIDTYQEYISFEEKSNDPARIQCIYERAIADNCLNSQLWSQYLKYLNKTLKSGPIVQSAFERAVRNCPWTSELWQNYLILLEKNDATVEKRESILNDALAAGFSSAGGYSYLWQTWCDQARRRYCDGNDKDRDELAASLRDAFQRSTSHLISTILPAFNETGDPDYTLWCYWAQCEARYLKNMKKARQIMDDFLQDDVDARRRWQIWREYYELERLHGDMDHARAVLRQAVQGSAADDGSAESACSYLIRFERENGSLEELEDSKRKVEARLAKVQKRKEKFATQAQEKKKHWEQNGQVRKKKWSKDPQKRDKAGHKRPIAHDERDIPEKRIKREKEAITSPATSPEGFKAPSSLPARFKKPQPKQEEAVKAIIKPSSAPPPGFRTKDAAETSRKTDDPSRPPTSQHADDRTERSPESEERTVFVSNIGFKVESLEDKLREIFKSCGHIESVRIARSNKGQLRGFAYVEFERKSSVQEALKLDRQSLEGRPLFVSPNVDKNKQPNFKVFKYDTGMEKHKLFVSGLSFDTSEDNLRDVFSSHGTLRSLRIVTARNGKSKGLAYVEYERESDASQAVIKSDQSVIDGFTITVAISNPPARNRLGPEKMLGGGDRAQVVGGRGRGRTQLSLIPRSLQKAAHNRAAGDGSSKMKDSNYNDIPATGDKPLNNRDFSKLFAKK